MAPRSGSGRRWRAARELGLAVEGVAFHVGSGAGADAAGAYALAVEAAAAARAVLEAEGHAISLLDVGGGFPGGDLGALAPALNAALDTHWPAAAGFRVVAEPGRFFAEPVASLLTAVYGARARVRDPAAADATPSRELFVTDGLYGSLNCILYDHASPVPRLLGGRPGPVAPTTVFGPTCDGLDTLVRDHPLPADAAVGDWLVWHDMGAYTLCGASNFNGMDAVNVPRFYVWSGP